MNEPDDAIKQKILYLRQVECLSLRRIASHLKMGHRRIKRILEGRPPEQRGRVPDQSILSFRALVENWYAQYPHLMAIKVYEKLKSYGYQGSLTAVERLTRGATDIKTDTRGNRALAVVEAATASMPWNGWCG